MRRGTSSLQRLVLVAVAAAIAATTQVAMTSTDAYAATCTNEAWNPWRYESDRAYTNGLGFAFQRRLNGDGAGQLEYTYQWAVGSGWRSWELLGGGIPMRGSPSATTNRDGRVVVFIISANTGAILFKYQVRAGSPTFSDWNSLGGVGASNPEVTQNYDGRIEVFVRGTDNDVYHRWQHLDYSWNRDWESLGGDFNSLVRAESGKDRSDGKIVINARGLDCYQYSKWQYTPGDDWYPPTWWYQLFYVG